MIPAALLANLNYVHPEVPVFTSHFRQFVTTSNSTGKVAQIIAERISHVHQITFATHRTLALGALTMMLCCPQ
jgi:hypothetical protein